MSVLNPYLMFPGNAREAMDRYHEVFGGELTYTTFGEAGMTDAVADGVMHAQLVTTSGFTLMASDLPPGMPAPAASGAVSISISGTEADELRGYWDGLVADGEVHVALETAPWGDVFGQCADRFGTTWMLNITAS